MTAETVKPHRLSLSDILTMTLQRGSGNQDSIELGRSARGETTIDIKFYAQDGESSEELLARSWEAYERTRAKFPTSAGYVGAVSDPQGSGNGDAT